MLQLLDARQLGIEPVWLAPRVYGSNKMAKLELSKEKEVQKGHSNGVTAIDVDPISSRYLLSGGTSGSVIIHDMNRPAGPAHFNAPIVGSVTGKPAHSHSVSMVQWYPHDTGIFITSSADKSVQIWDTNELNVVEMFNFPDPVFCHEIAAASKHCLIAVGTKAGNVTLCDMQSGAASHILRGHKKGVLSVRWSPRNEFILATGSLDNRILVWDVRKARGPLMSMDQHNGGGGQNSASVVTAHNGYVSGLCYSSDGLLLVSSGTDDRVRLWDIVSGRNSLINYGSVPHGFKYQTHMFTLTPHTLTLSPLLCVPVGSDIVMYELFSGKKIKKLRGHYGSVSCCAVSGRELELYSGGSDNNILVWAPPQDKVVSSSGDRRGSVSRQAAVYADAWSSDED